MTLDIKDAEADGLAGALAKETGESLTAAVTTAVRERLKRIRGRAGAGDLVEELTTIAVRCASLPLLAERPEEQVRGYDEHGLPT